MQTKSNAGRTFRLPTKVEEAAIADGIAAALDTYELGNPEFTQLRRVGRLSAAVTKERNTIRLPWDVVERFRTSGDGWQTRMDAALKDWLKNH